MAVRLTGVLLAWAACGAVAAFGLGAAFTPWLLLLLPASGVALLLGRRFGLDRRAWAALAGAGWLPLWLAWLDRGGPGDVCTGPVDASSCTTEGSPWPWLVLGLVMVVAGLALAAAPLPSSESGRSGPSKRRKSPPEPPLSGEGDSPGTASTEKV